MPGSMHMKIGLLLTLPAISMLTPFAVESVVSTAFQTAQFLAVAVVVMAWFRVYRQTYQAAGTRRRWVLLFLLLLPFVLCYPAWFVIAALMSGWKGPPL